MAAQPCLCEPYSRRPDVDRVCSYVIKLFAAISEFERAVRRERQLPLPESELPHPWGLISPFASLSSRALQEPHQQLLDGEDRIWEGLESERLTFLQHPHVLVTIRAGRSVDFDG